MVERVAERALCSRGSSSGRGMAASILPLLCFTSDSPSIRRQNLTRSGEATRPIHAAGGSEKAQEREKEKNDKRAREREREASGGKKRRRREDTETRDKLSWSGSVADLCP